MEQRKSRRYQITVPAYFWWKSCDGMRHEGTGITKDICTLGTFILTEKVPQRGRPVEIAISLSFLEGAGHSVQLHGEGKVVRAYEHDTNKNLKGFAAEVALQVDACDKEAIVISPMLH